MNHGRNSWREVVSYAGAVDETRDATVNPNTEGLFRVDIETGERTLIISYQALVTSLASLGYAVDPASPLSIHRTCWNRDSNRIDFVVRWPGGVAVEFVIRTDGTNLAQIPSPRHPEWLDGPVMTCENKEGWLDLYNVDSASYTSAQIGSTHTPRGGQGYTLTAPQGAQRGMTDGWRW